MLFFTPITRTVKVCESSTHRAGWMPNFHHHAVSVLT